MVDPKVSGRKGSQDAFFSVQVPADYPIRGHFTQPCPHMEHLPMTESELVAYNNFDCDEGFYTYEDRKEVTYKDPNH